MTNAQKYKTPEERIEAFAAFCEKQQSCEKCIKISTICRRYNGPECVFRWLELEAEEEKPLPCPFCGGEAHVIDCTEPCVQCSECEVHTINYSDRFEAVAAWNRRMQ